MAGAYIWVACSFLNVKVKEWMGGGRLGKGSGKRREERETVIGLRKIK